MSRYINIIVLFFLTVSCEEIFVPDIPDQPNTLVIEGLITDQVGRHFVKISRALAYNDTSNFENVSGFTVLIQERGGAVYLLHEFDDGWYATDSLVQGKPNHDYRVIATSPQGRQYISSFVTLLSAAPVDSLNGVYKTRSRLVYHDATGYEEVVNEGIEVQSNSAVIDCTPFYRYEYNLIIQTMQVYATYPIPTTFFIASPYNSISTSFVAIANANSFENKRIRGKPILLFLNSWMNNKIDIPFEFNDNGERIFTDEQIATIRAGIIIRVNQLSLDKKGYEFWESVYNQINVTGQLFDPVESQIVGNIQCAEDTTERVFGYFGASSVNSSVRFFDFDNNYNIIARPVSIFPELPDTFVDRRRPDFWITE
ncbi:MAG: DUF4249 domain-containing protein [Bacteroidales bacterium]|nr:DUF4249 domain-containing protein [Bacteroidales bacterium]